MKKEIRKILQEKTETLKDGRVVIVPNFSQLDELVDDLNTLFELRNSSLLLKDKEIPTFEEWLTNFKKIGEDLYLYNKNTQYCKNAMHTVYDALPDE
jgi:hypothetical protein